MLKKTLFISLLALLPLIYSCRTSSKLVTSQSTVQLAQDYINAYKDIAVSEMKRTGIPASITLAQGMVESDFGRSSLAREANNHFGIKCHEDWVGPYITKDDDSKDECFRKYISADRSFYDHSDFLKSKPRYGFLFEIASTDYKSWAHGLKKAGYATNPDYANMLIRKIEENNLSYYDSGYKPVKMPSQLIAGSKDTLASTTTANANVSVIKSDNMAKAETPMNNNIVVFARTPRVLENNKIQYIVVKMEILSRSLRMNFRF
jgi:hypothetical protein